jgi:hypothetical protein
MESKGYIEEVPETTNLSTMNVSPVSRGSDVGVQRDNSSPAAAYRRVCDYPMGPSPKTALGFPRPTPERFPACQLTLQLALLLALDAGGRV